MLAVVIVVVVIAAQIEYTRAAAVAPAGDGNYDEGIAAANGCDGFSWDGGGDDDTFW